ncbi:hypothetical protein [Sphingomonas sp. TDK1]|uniref:hypothetical protein n=1 Tax=Sphingomonas sp. TDK1 TaxID=453247 RepID=UPI0007D99FEA|nr:hypothetical protein [Sphingomonas sp. TDK1]OAN57086.1 hypothetical protein A7X12_07555 [Sphingomonas sp. TDK1]
MTTYRTRKFLGLIPVAAVLATTLVAAAPAQAAADPEATPTPAAKKDFRSLDRRARGLIWCIERKAEDGTDKKTKQCKTREAWIREGNDPLREY